MAQFVIHWSRKRWETVSETIEAATQAEAEKLAEQKWEQSSYLDLDWDCGDVTGSTSWDLYDDADHHLAPSPAATANDRS